VVINSIPQKREKTMTKIPPPLKRFGQNFLINTFFSEKIVQSLAISVQDTIIEIGPGKGALSQLIIAQNPQKFIAIEIDRKLSALLKEQYGSQMEIINDDFLKVDITKYGTAIKIIGNIPYNITTPIIFSLIEQRQWVSEAVIMMQKEVAQRITATTKENKAYGIPSILCQTYADIDYLFEVKRNNFSPAPKVDSAVVKFTFKKKIHDIKNEELFKKIVRTTFNYRRKTLRNTLGRIFDKTVVYSLDKFDLSKRPENLSIDEFKQLANTLHYKLRNNND
jgi:16S rRNA (adenine1518-N6/adenine1519-N6)-dimethyltransferase